MSAEYGPSRSPLDTLDAVKDRQSFEDRCFAAWMLKVDAWLVARCGLSSADLDDCCYRDWFDDGESPAQAGREALRAAKGE